MTTDRLAALLHEDKYLGPAIHEDAYAAQHPTWPATECSACWSHAARLAAAGVTLASVDSGARQRLLDVIHGMDPQGIPPGGIEPLVDAAIRAGVTLAQPALDVEALARARFADWLVSELAYPMDVRFETPPPLTLDEVAEAWHRLDPSTSLEDWRWAVEADWPVQK